MYSYICVKLNSGYQVKPNDPEVYRLLGEVKFGMKDFEGSAAAYRTAAKVSTPPNKNHEFVTNVEGKVHNTVSSSCVFLDRFQIKWIFKFSVVSQMHCLLLRNLMRYVM